MCLLSWLKTRLQLLFSAVRRSLEALKVMNGEMRMLTKQYILILIIDKLN